MRIASVIALWLAFGASSVCYAGDVSRVLRRFDFEERRFNVETLPVDWEKIEGPGMPHYVNGRLSASAARSGKYSFQFDLNGGSLTYRYPAGKIPVRQGAFYRVEGWARTTPLQHAKARLTAYLTDLDGNPILPSVQHSKPYAAERADQMTWESLAVELAATDDRAAFLVVEIALLQPGMYRSSTLGQRALNVQDIRGTAWFDDITVSQVPRVSLSTRVVGNIFPVGTPMVVDVEVNDRHTEDLSAQLVIRDADGALVFQKSQALDGSSIRATERGTKLLSVPLPELPVGWYDISMAMSSMGEALGEQHLAVVRLGDRAGMTNIDRRIGMIATGMPFEVWRDLPATVSQLGAGRVKLAVWSEAGDVLRTKAVKFDEILDELSRAGVVPTACLIGLPPEVAARVGGSSWLNLLKAAPDAWQSQLSYLVARHATRLERWQLGDDGEPEFVTSPPMREVFQKVYDEFAKLVQEPNLAIPWPGWYELDATTPRNIAMSLPASVLPAQVPLYVQAGRDALGAGGREDASVSLQLLDRAEYGRAMQIRDFAQRFTAAMAAGATLIDIPMPFEVQRAGERITAQPTELFIIQRTLSMLLGNSTFKGKVPLAENVEAHLFDRDGQSVLIIWAKGNEAGVKDLNINLGERPVMVDLWGNVTPLLAGGRDRQTARVQVSTMPIFLLDVDGEMAQLRASVGWDNDHVESSFKSHLRKLHFTNPYKYGISGQIRLRGPTGWLITPAVQQFTLNPGETWERDVSIEFPYNTFAGSKAVSVEFTVQGIRGARDAVFSVPAPLQLGLSDIGLQTIALRDGADVLVQQMITNYGNKPIDYSSFAIFPGHARQERLVTNLGPGRTTIKKYRFTDVRFDQTTMVRSGIKELEGTRILNDEVEVR
ncbi:MAG TPA: hypothetical protein PLD59_14755 [Tepidisphaeraceae bacterium]|nr:hypothetical protein [Tepidisphaeraceae bacterium]